MQPTQHDRRAVTRADLVDGCGVVRMPVHAGPHEMRGDVAEIGEPGPVDRGEVGVLRSGKEAFQGGAVAEFEGHDGGVDQPCAPAGRVGAEVGGAFQGFQRESRRAPGIGTHRGIGQRGGDLVVMGRRGGRPVPDPAVVVIGQGGGQRGMCITQPIRLGGLDDRRPDQRMPEPHPHSVGHHQTRPNRRTQRGRLDRCARQHRRGPRVLLDRIVLVDGGDEPAFVHHGRIFKTLHLLQFLHDEGYRRMMGAAEHARGPPSPGPEDRGEVAADLVHAAAWVGGAGGKRVERRP
ncbi:hypothetical protein ACFQ0J_18535 [Planotetraspora mira]|uniref:hypothetical protein n=1 Tax=Planotetraspora mira TaxID=58121 RepID=UPI001950395D|nr:hypothetical protein [Planotetraspora mira]